MKNNVLSYSSDGQAAIRNEFDRAIDPIRAQLKSVMRTVESLDTWWKGGSAKDFVRACEEMCKDVESTLDNWLDGHKDLVARVGERKARDDRSIRYTSV